MARPTLGMVHIVPAVPVSVPHVIVHVMVIADCMAKNAALFPSPPVPIATFRAHIEELKAAEVAMMSRTVGLKTYRDDALLTVKKEVAALANYVTQLANGSPASAAKLATAAAMVVRRFGGRKAGWLTLATLSRGVVSARAPVLRGAVAYEWALSTNGGETWTVLPTTAQARCRIERLEPATAIMLRVRAVTRKGLTDWSIPAVFVVGAKRSR